MRRPAMIAAAVLALLGAWAAALAAEEDAAPPAQKEREGPKEKARPKRRPPRAPDEGAEELPKGHFRIRAHAKAGHTYPSPQPGKDRIGEAFEVRREGRLVAYAAVAENVENWPKLAYLLGAGQPGDELAPLTPPIPRVQLFTDERNAPITRELKALLDDKLVIEELGDQITIHKDCEARIVVIHGGVFFMGGDPIAGPFARQGGTVVLDTLAYSQIKGEIADETKFKEPTTLRIVREEGVTRGFPPESRLPWYGQGKKGKGYVARYISGLPQADSPEKLLATDHSTKNSAILDVDYGGHMIVTDLLSPTGRAGRDPGAKNKLIFLARALGSGPRYARYMAGKPDYEDVIKWFDDLADKNKDKMAKSFEGGGEKKEDFIYSYTLGAKDKPPVVLAGCLRGTAWLGASALLRLAEVMLEAPEAKTDWLLERLRVKIIPVLNPVGYRKDTATNENGADPDRNFPYQWAEFADKKLRGREPFSEAGSAVIKHCIEGDKAIALLELGVDDYDAGYRIVRARDASEAQTALLHSLVALANERLRYRFVVGDAMLQLRLTRDAARPSAINWAGAQGALAASLRICGDAEDSITNHDVAVETCLQFLHALALSRERPEPAPPPREPPKKAPKPAPKAGGK